MVGFMLTKLSSVKLSSDINCSAWRVNQTHPVWLICPCVWTKKSFDNISFVSIFTSTIDVGSDVRHNSIFASFIEGSNFFTMFVSMNDTWNFFRRELVLPLRIETH